MSEELAEVVDAIKRWLDRWRAKSERVVYVKLDQVRGIACCDSKRFYGVVRRNTVAIAEALGARSAQYQKGEYTPSGSGAFGRLGGGKRGHTSDPMLRVEFYE